MPDPMSFVWSHVDLQEPFFSESTARLLLGAHFDRLANLRFLVPAENAASVACPSCLDHHFEEVVAVDQADNTQRFYIACPEHVRVEIPQALLCQWTVGCDTLAEPVAKALALAGRCTSLVEGRLWRLGRTKWQGVSRDVLFARGLNWVDGGNVATRIARCTRPIVFVGDRVPPIGVWPGRVPPIVTLSQVTNLGEGGLVTDYEAVLAAILDADAMPPSASQEPINTRQLALMIRRQIKAEEKTKLTDDILVAAYQQEGSVRKAAAFLSDRTGQAVTKDKVQNALRRNGGLKAVIHSKDRGKPETMSSQHRSMWPKRAKG